MEAKTSSNSRNETLFATLLCKISSLLQSQTFKTEQERFLYSKNMMVYLLSADGYLLSHQEYIVAIDYFLEHQMTEQCRFMYFILKHYYNFGQMLFDNYIKKEEYEKCAFLKNLNFNQIKIESIEYNEKLINTADIDEILAESIAQLFMKQRELDLFMEHMINSFKNIIAQ